MAVAGCSNYSAIASVYVLGLSYQNASGNGLDITQTHMSETLRQQIGSAELAVRVGYFGMCVQQPGGLWLCSSSADELLEQIGGNNDPLALIKTGSKFREEVLFSPMLFISVVLSCLAMLLLATFPGWHEETDETTGSLVDVKPFPSRPVSQVALLFSFISSVLMLVTSLWQHVGCVGAATLAESAYYNNIKAEVGSGAMIMVWGSFTLTIVTMISLVAMIISIVILDRLSDESTVSW